MLMRGWSLSGKEKTELRRKRVDRGQFVFETDPTWNSRRNIFVHYARQPSYFESHRGLSVGISVKI